MIDQVYNSVHIHDGPSNTCDTNAKKIKSDRKYHYQQNILDSTLTKYNQDKTDVLLLFSILSIFYTSFLAGSLQDFVCHDIEDSVTLVLKLVYGSAAIGQRHLHVALKTSKLSP